MLILIGSALFDIASHDPELLQPAKSGPEQPSSNAFRYTLDLLLPVVDFKQRDVFAADGWAAWAAFGFIFAGLGECPLFLAVRCSRTLPRR